MCWILILLRIKLQRLHFSSSVSIVWHGYWKPKYFCTYTTLLSLKKIWNDSMFLYRWNPRYAYIRARCDHLHLAYIAIFVCTWWTTNMYMTNRKWEHNINEFVMLMLSWESISAQFMTKSCISSISDECFGVKKNKLRSLISIVVKQYVSHSASFCRNIYLWRHNTCH